MKKLGYTLPYMYTDYGNVRALRMQYKDDTPIIVVDHEGKEWYQTHISDEDVQDDQCYVLSYELLMTPQEKDEIVEMALDFSMGL